MKCPECHGHAKVVDVRSNAIGLRRRYDCGVHRFTTYLMEQSTKDLRARVMVEFIVEVEGTKELKDELAGLSRTGMVRLARKLQKTLNHWRTRR